MSRSPDAYRWRLRSLPSAGGYKPSDAGPARQSALTGIAASATLRALPTQLDLFTAIAGGGAIGGIVGGATAWALAKDLTQGTVLGGLLGMILGALLALLQSSGIYS